MPSTLPDKAVVNDQTPLYNCGVLGNYINYLESHHADVDIDDLLRCSRLSRLDLNDDGYFLTQSQINLFHHCLDERISDPKIAYKVGQHALYSKSTGTMKQYGLQFVSPASLYKAVDRLYPKWSKGHLSQTVITGKGRAELTISVHPGVREEHFQCENRQGILEAMGELLTGHSAQVTHLECMHRGDDVCHYQIAWKDKSSTAWKRAGAYTSACCLAIAAAAPFVTSAVYWPLMVMAMGLVCLSILLVASRLETKELSSFLKEQGNAAGQLLIENENRYQDSRLVQEIGQAGADILNVNSFFDAVLESMSRNLGFTRGMIALCNDQCSRLYHATNYGFSRAERQVLGQLDLAIDGENPTDMFIQSLKRRRPAFLSNIRSKMDGLNPESISLIESLKIDALIIVPLIYKKKPLGLLFMDAEGAKREYTASGVNLLMGIASQIATGIVNARSYTQMQASEQRYRLLAEKVTDVIWILDLDTLKMTYVSPSVEKTQGYTPDEIMALSIDQYLTPESFQRATSTLGRAMDAATAGEIDPDNYAMTLELEEYHKNGTVIPIEVTTGFLADETGKPSGILGISRDLSERNKAEKERFAIDNRLQQAQKMESLGTLAGSIAHNFNNLLMVVMGNLEIAKEDLSETSTAGSCVKRAIHASQRAADLSAMMLTYVGQLKKESLPVDLSHLVTAELEKMDESKLAYVTMDLDLAAPMPLVAADTDQMRQVISGLITNAIEALEEKNGTVRISTGSMHCDANYLSTTYLKEEMPEGIYAYVKVADTGCGMDAETLGKVFDPFFSTKFTGRGLGMAAVMGIIRSHYGAIKVSSEKHAGTVFTVLFPIQGVALGQVSADPREIETGPAGKTILLVDDEAMVKEIGSQFLERLGYGVKAASSGREALAIFKQAPDHIDCLLLDFTMPGMDGLETMQAIRKIRPNARIIITSGYARQQIEDRFIHIGHPDGFIHKPFEMKVLQEKLHRVLSDAG